MMGYTHVITGALGGIGFALLSSDFSPKAYLTATVFGALGGVAVDIDAKDRLTNPKVTDAGRSRIAIVGMLFLGAILDYAFHLGTIQALMENSNFTMYGAIGFLILLIVGHFSEHRTFTHSLLFVLQRKFLRK